ncbi:uncharacterized protein LOC132250428 [Alligator mississippiensis]|uniref:uncharacterized protein LOC132250428 n=1 Tax=Alligator mississippiensis TaxID=8496 RepID=UPI002877F8DC|nr:uncharacterized protein LOC132250428 [Alligator mississippiensis]
MKAAREEQRPPRARRNSGSARGGRTSHGRGFRAGAQQGRDRRLVFPLASVRSEAIGWSGRLGAVTTTPPFFALIGLWRGGGTRNLTSYLHSDWLPGTGGGVCGLMCADWSDSAPQRPRSAVRVRLTGPRCPEPTSRCWPGRRAVRESCDRLLWRPRAGAPGAALVTATCCSSCPRPWSRRVSEGPQPQRIGPWGRRAPRSCHVCKGRSRHLDGCAGPAAVPRKQPRRHGRQMQNSAEASQFLEASFSGQRSSQELDETTRSDISERLSVEDVGC